jgi:hypothetical protein
MECPCLSLSAIYLDVSSFEAECSKPECPHSLHLLEQRYLRIDFLGDDFQL